jgi:V8-like Glu-specific endopeptidase
MTPILPLLAVVPLVAGLVGAPPAGPAGSGGDRRPAATDTPASTADSGASYQVVEHAAARSEAEQRRVLAYWTPRRMDEALPVTLLGTVAEIGKLASGTLPLRALSTPPRDRAALRAVSGPPLSQAAPPALLPLSPPASSATPRPATAGSPPGSVAAGAGAPRVNTSGARWASGGAVTRTTGRVFFTMRDVDYVCSAGAVKSHNLDVVVTAGHCVKDGAGAWASNWTFVPGYDAGNRPYGVFTARRMFVAEPWSQNGDDSYDVAMIAVNPSGRGHLNEAVGGQEIGFNAPRGMRAYGFGFPADPPYDGEHLIYCSGGVHGDPHDQTRDQGMRCDLTAGSSGGPWLSSFDPATGQGVVTSVSSFKYSDDPGTMYGPYFGDQVRHLFEAAQRA